MANPDSTISPIGQLRTALRSSADPRPGRTRQAILGAVHVLAGEEREAITVGDIVAQAQISRSAFYTQFAGIDELALSVLSEALDEMMVLDGLRTDASESSRSDVARMGLSAFVQHVEENRALYASVLSLPFTYLTYTRFIEALAARVAEAIEAAGLIDDQPRIRSTSTYVAGGLLAVLHLWLRGELPGTAETLVDELMALHPPAYLFRGTVPARDQ